MLNKFAVAFISLTLLLCSCGVGSSGRQSPVKHTVTIAGSTSIMPFTEKLAEYFIVGHPGYVVDVQGGGSTAGIQAALNDTVDLGMSSRELNQSESILNRIIICHDGISIILHPANPVKELSLSQIRDIYSGKIRNWKSLGWIDRGIDVITREEGSGTRGAFEDLVMKKTEISDSNMVQDSNGSVKEVVATDPYAIGYISLGLLDARVKPLLIDGAAPTLKDIKKGRYKIVRPFLYVTKGEPGQNARLFVDFVLSREGQNILKKEGLITLYD